MTRRVGVRGRVHVRQQVIDNAVRKHSHACMIADALREAFPGATGVAVDVQSMRLSIPQDSRRYIWMTPKAVQKEIVRFDLGVKPKEFSFNLPTDVQIIPMRKGQGPKKAKMTDVHPTKSKPSIIGGTAPPMLSFRREFGLMGINVHELLQGE